ncbi:MAG: N-acetylmuramoyl-L-alanine amidase [Alphaproteobacteria bacterium]|nr:N-acetylmuramoyl-L-alanine amidase [Alphaproteobacteria bacterium]
MIKVLRFFAIFLLFAASAPAVSQAGESSIQNIRVANHADNVMRLVIDLSEKSGYKVFTLKNPERLVIDIENTDFAEDLNPQLANINYLNKLRFGKMENGVGRIVAEVDFPPEVKKDFILPPQSGFAWRLVVDVETTKSDYAEVEKKKEVAAKPVRKPLLMIDAGHGGKDCGAISISGSYEKHLTLKMAKELRDKLLKTGRYNVMMTRSDDRALALRQRVQMARNAKADVFISIHADSAHNSAAKGLSVYTLSERASDSEAAALAERENKADAVIGMDFSDKPQDVATILIDLVRRDTMNNSSILADYMVVEMKKNVTVLPNTHRFAGFAVLKAPDIPSVLVEIGYLSNRKEELMLRRPEYREKLASSMVKALDKLFKNHNIMDK